MHRSTSAIPRNSAIVLAFAVVGCTGGGSAEDIDILDDGFPSYVPGYTIVADSDDRVFRPQDLDFHPDRPDELWVVNKGTENSGSDVVIIHDAGLPSQESERRIDGNAWHFMNLTSAIAFSSDNGNWASTPEITDANHRGGTFTGPSLWSGDLDVFAMPSGGNGSHLDMLHQSPNSMGIAHEVDNAFWVFDGYSDQIVRYDFQDDHGPGNADHADGRLTRYGSLPITRLPGTPSHMVIDKPTGWLYICDPGNSQILRLDITSGEEDFPLEPALEPLDHYMMMKDEVWQVFADTDLVEPSGVDIDDDTLYITDAATGEIIAYLLDTGEELGRIQTFADRIAGIKVGPRGNLWYVDRRDNTVVRVDQN